MLVLLVCDHRLTLRIANLEDCWKIGCWPLRGEIIQQSNFRTSRKAGTAATFPEKCRKPLLGAVPPQLDPRIPRPGPTGRTPRGPAPPPAPPRPAPPYLALGPWPGKRPVGWGRAMSHGAGVVRTTCSSSSSSSAFGPGAGAAQPGGGPSEGLLDPVYPRTQGALLKLAQMVTLLIAFICVRSSLWTDYSAYSYFEVVTICDLIMILAFYLVHLFRLYRVLTCISWPLSELLHYVIGTLLLLIASIVAASRSYSQSGLVAGAIFGFLATFLCMESIWLSYKISCVTQSTDAAV
ncbi:LOW QUALITY PROTEIN: CKLF-like MARVEL transmembrane domain-containing protein 7 [Choloepus didactylus]|uniref:LOW QUALITY PROTEIN: CKLF-like MARVEL transmembrane domain-containing protein 7 n=1 Tax=Choloepus didactylus TaxID=27675 RepID=UPI0018A03593|nr:LOW QUALITY PROTEIN: CKLF-like MARVEL transmembrane domain-containing protein 7 [Choloepus didactylus]